MVNVAETFNNVKVQPAEALRLAQPYLAAYGTDQWAANKPFDVVIVKKTCWRSERYYISQNNDPTKTLHYDLKRAIIVDAHTEEVT